MITSIGTMTIHEGKEAEVLRGVDELIAGVAKEAGVLLYLVNTADVPDKHGKVQKPVKLVFYESYANQEAIDVHLGTISGKPKSAYNVFIEKYGSDLTGWKPDDLKFILFNRRGSVITTRAAYLGD